MAKRARVAPSSPITTASLEASSPNAEAERSLRRSLGPTAWAVLDDLRLDAVPGGAGRPVVSTSARRVADHLGITKNTAARALCALISAGIVRRRPQDTGVAGRFTRGTYELLVVPTIGTPCPPNRDTVALAGAHAAAPGPARRRNRTTAAWQSAQLSLLEPAAVNRAGDEGDT